MPSITHKGFTIDQVDDECEASIAQQLIDMWLRHYGYEALQLFADRHYLGLKVIREDE